MYDFHTAVLFYFYLNVYTAVILYVMYLLNEKFSGK